MPSGVPLSTQSTQVLTKQVTAFGLCTRVVVTADNDPWYPVAESGEKAIAAARAACAGCPVQESCLELALREETVLGAVHGIRGGRSAAERQLMVRRRRATGGAR